MVREILFRIFRNDKCVEVVVAPNEATNFLKGLNIKTEKANIPTPLDGKSVITQAMLAKFDLDQ